MNRLIVFLVIFFQMTLFAHTQNSTDYLTLKNGDTLFGTIKDNDNRYGSRRFYRKIRLTDTKGKRRKIKVDNIISVKVGGINYEAFRLNQISERIQLVNPKYNIDSNYGETEFLRVVSKGFLSHYRLEWWEQGDARQYEMDLLKKDDDNFFIRATQGVFGLKRKVLASYFFECSDLVQKIKAKEINQVRALIIFYNNNCIK